MLRHIVVLLRSSGAKGVAGLLDDYVLLEPRDLGFVHILPNLAPELLDRRVRSVFLELPQHASPNSRNAQNLGVGGCVDVDRYDRRSTGAGAARRRTRCRGRRSHGSIA